MEIILLENGDTLKRRGRNNKHLTQINDQKAKVQLRMKETRQKREKESRRKSEKTEVHSEGDNIVSISGTNYLISADFSYHCQTRFLRDCLDKLGSSMTHW